MLSCYHSSFASWKTETLLSKLRMAEPPQALPFVRELAHRDRALARATVLQYAAFHPSAKPRKPVQHALCYVADLELARTLVHAPHFDPNALHVDVLAALIEERLDALDALAPAEAVAEIDRLGLLAPGGPQPWVESAVHVARSAPFDALLLRTYTALLRRPALAAVHARIAERMRELGSAAQDATATELVRAWRTQALPAVVALPAVAALGAEGARALVGEAGLGALVEAAVAELGQRPADAPALGRELFAATRVVPAPWATRLAVALLDTPAGTDLHALVARALAREHGEVGARAVCERAARVPADALVAASASLGAEGARCLLAHAARLDEAVVTAAAARLPYAEAAAQLGPHAVAALHPALFFHAHAPMDLGLVARARAELAGDPDAALLVLERVASHPTHPHRDDAIAALADQIRSGPLRVRKAAAHFFARTGRAAATPELVALLDDPAFADARMFVLSALGDCADARALPPLAAQPTSALVAQTIARIEARYRHTSG